MTTARGRGSLYLPGVAEALVALDLSPIEGASFVYVNCYQLIEAAAVRAIQAAQAAGAPLLANLGGSPLSPTAAATLRGCSRLIVQTNVDDAAHLDAPRLFQEAGLSAASDG